MQTLESERPPKGGLYTLILVLDNFVSEVKAAKERMDLQVVYLTDVDGNVILIDDDGRKRRIKSEIGHRKLSKLKMVKQHIFETREKYNAYNDGRPLFGN
ncbi:MAG: hypothetical protein Q8O37_00810 [Sulfuricellaceae bacterium]|nr:hypothetical protein [Sulfuricellaceae bacterium]